MAIRIPEQSAPGTPASGYMYVYAKTDGRMYYKGDDGVERAVGSPVFSVTPVSASGTSVDITGIPSGVVLVVVSFYSLSTNGTSSLLCQIGDSGGVETTSYSTAGGIISTVGNTISNRTDGWGDESGNAAASRHGMLTLSLANASNNTWLGQLTISRSDSAVYHVSTGSKALSATLDRVRITTGNGTDTFDAGTISAIYVVGA